MAKNGSSQKPASVPAQKARVKREVTAITPKQSSRKRIISMVNGPGIEIVPIAKLKANPTNARKHSESQIAEIANSIRRFDFNNPVLISQDNVIYGGHGRVMAAKLLGMDVVPCIRSKLSRNELRAYAIADNRIALNSAWDTDMLAAEVRDLVEADITMTGLGFDDKEYKDLLAVQIELPELGDSPVDGVADPTTERDDGPEDRASREDLGGQNGDEPDDEDDDGLTPVADDERSRYHQLPPDEASRAIRASEERIPLAILLNRDESQKFNDYKQHIGAKSDKDAFAVLMGWKNLNADSPQTAEKITKSRKEKSGGNSEAHDAAVQT